MAIPFDPGPIPAGLGAWLGGLPVSLLDEEVYAGGELVDRYATELAIEIANSLGLGESLIAGSRVDEMIAALDFDPRCAPALRALLDRLVDNGEIECTATSDSFHRNRPLRASRRQELRETGLERVPSTAPTLDLLDAAADAYPVHAREGRSGEELLMTPALIPLWLRYFANDNPVYALSNQIAAAVATHWLPTTGPLRILEVGAGAGSAAGTLLSELERLGRLDALELYDVTEPSPYFRRRAERELGARFPGLPLIFRTLDLNRAFDEQGGAAGYDLAFGVNVIHVAHRLEASLGRLRDALRPGGALVAGECFRLFPRQAVPADLIFQLFRSFTEVEVDRSSRPHHGFLTPESWRAAFTGAGFAGVKVVPDLEKIRERYPRFYAGAICGRRPAS